MSVENLLLEKFDSPMLQARQEIEIGYPEKAVKLYVNAKEFGLAGDTETLMCERDKVRDVAAAEAHRAKAREYYAIQLEKYVKEGTFRLAGRVAVKMGDNEQALELFVKGFWYEDASKVATQLGRAEEAKSYAEKAKIPRTAVMDAAGCFDWRKHAKR